MHVCENRGLFEDVRCPPQPVRALFKAEFSRQLKMKLSKSARAVAESAELSGIAAKLIGEFAGTDVSLLPGDVYYTLVPGGRTFNKFERDGTLYANNVAENQYLHEWKVRRRTPCSIVTEYWRTVVICHGIDTCRKFTYTLPSHRGWMRRFFPKNADQQIFARQHAEMFDFLPDCTISYTRRGNFFLEFEEGSSPFQNILPTFPGLNW